MRKLSKVMVGLLVAGAVGSMIPASAATITGTIAAFGGTYPTPEEFAFVGQGCTPAANVKDGVAHAVISLSGWRGKTVTITPTATTQGPSSVGVVIYSNCDPVAWFSAPAPNGVTAVPGHPFSFTVNNQTAVVLFSGLQALGQTYRLTTN